MSEAARQREIVAQGLFYALFRVVEIEELSGPAKAVEWARAMVEDADLRRAFSERVLEALAERASREAESPPGSEGSP